MQQASDHQPPVVLTIAGFDPSGGAGILADIKAIAVMGGFGVAAITSLMPGTLPCGESETEIVFHCLDIEQPILAELAEGEAMLAGVLETGNTDG